MTLQTGQTDQKSLPEFVADVATELEQTVKELKEIEMLIKQSGGEVDKLSQRNAQIASRMRQIEANFETYPREDIKSSYAAMQESQMRLFMMRSQLEQLQAKQQWLDKYVVRLRSILSYSGGLGTLTPTAPKPQNPTLYEK